MEYSQTRLQSDVSLVIEKLIPNLSVVHQVIIGTALKGGTKISDLLHFTVGERRSCAPSEQGMFCYGISSIKGNHVFFLDSNTEQQLSNYCYLERKLWDRKHKDFDELDDGDFVFINRHGNRVALPALVLDWNKTCQKMDVKIHLYQIHRLLHLYTLNSGVPISAITNILDTGANSTITNYYSES